MRSPIGNQNPPPPPPGMMYSRAQGPSVAPQPPSGMMYGKGVTQTMAPPPGGSRPFGSSPGAVPYGRYSPGKHALDNDRAGQAMNSYNSLGTAGMNAMGQYGASVANSLANQSIAAGNTFGQMANSYYNTLGQLGHVGGSLAAAGLSAGANSARGRMDFGGGGGYGGFDVFGPGGGVAGGSMGGGYGGGGGGSYFERGASPAERMGMTKQGYNFLNAVRRDLPGGHALAGLANDQFTANREATMDPRFVNSMNSMFMGSQAGIDTQSGFGRRAAGYISTPPSSRNLRRRVY